MQIVPDEYSQRHPSDEDINVGQVLSWTLRPDGELELLYAASGTTIAPALLAKKRERLLAVLRRL